MLDQFTSITQKFNQEVESGMDAHEAERHVIKSIQEVGRSMISKWAQKTQTEAVKEACRSVTLLVCLFICVLFACQTASVVGLSFDLSHSKAHNQQSPQPLKEAGLRN